jgi:hypothetical protein
MGHEDYEAMAHGWEREEARAAREDLDAEALEPERPTRREIAEDQVLLERAWRTPVPHARGAVNPRPGGEGR